MTKGNLIKDGQIDQLIPHIIKPIFRDDVTRVFL